MTMSLEDQLRAVAKASLDPPDDAIQAAEEDRLRHHSKLPWAVCAAALVTGMVVVGIALNRAGSESNSGEIVVQSDPDTSDGGGAFGYASDFQDLRPAILSEGNVLVVVGTIGESSDDVTLDAPGDSPATMSYTPVTIVVDETLRNTEDREVGPVLTLRSWAEQRYNGKALHDLEPGTRVVAFIQTPATLVSDGADTATAVFEIDSSERIHDPMSGVTIPVSSLQTYVRSPDLLDGRSLTGAAIRGVPATVAIDDPTGQGRPCVRVQVGTESKDACPGLPGGAIWRVGGENLVLQFGGPYGGLHATLVVDDPSEATWSRLCPAAELLDALDGPAAATPVLRVSCTPETAVLQAGATLAGEPGPVLNLTHTGSTWTLDPPDEQ